MAKKHSRRMSRKHRATRRRHHRMRGGDSTPASTGGDPMKGMMAQSLAQGQQYANMHAAQHGGGPLDAGPFPGAVTEQSLLPANLATAARVAPLNAALNAIANMKDPGQAGGARRGRKGRKASRKGRKASRKGRKASRKGRKATRKGRKASRKNRKTRRMRGGAAYMSNPASVTAPGMLLEGSQLKAALSGMNAEWKIAENPNAFAPGVAKNY
jgi:hypothetical protein